MILDTSVVIEPGLSLPNDCAVSVATLAELHYGVHTAPDAELRGRRLVQLGEVEALFDAIPIDAPIAREYGRVCASARARGLEVRRRAMDLLIAATARALQVPLLSLDADLLALGDLLDVRRPD